MCVKCIASFALGALIVSAAADQAAGETPAFLDGGKKYATAPGICQSLDDGEGDGYTLTATGVFGYEFGCNFATFLPVRAEGETEPFIWVGVAACGDDSGISRPDSFTLGFYEDRVVVTSQNDYVSAESKGFDEKVDHFKTGIIDKTFELCR